MTIDRFSGPSIDGIRDRYRGEAMFFQFRAIILFLTFLLFFITILGCNNMVDAWQTAPDFTLEDLSANKVSLSQYRGNVVLLDFWATWCGPCRIAIPKLVGLNEKYRDRGLVILAISMDDPELANNKYLSAFKKKYKINYPVLRSTSKVALDYFGTEQMPIPTLFVINREGKVVDKHVGFAPEALERSLKKVL
jgi:peroxiredoxin